MCHDKEHKFVDLDILPLVIVLQNGAAVKNNFYQLYNKNLNERSIGSLQYIMVWRKWLLSFESVESVHTVLKPAQQGLHIIVAVAIAAHYQQVAGRR